MEKLRWLQSVQGLFFCFPISSEKSWNQQIVELKIFKKEQSKETEVGGMQGGGERKGTCQGFLEGLQESASVES